MADAVKGVNEVSVAGVAGRLAEAGVLGARGNSGMMLSHFFLGFAEGLEGRRKARSHELARAMRRACDSLYQAVEVPVEGTILTVARESSEELERLSGKIRDLQALARRLLGAARTSLDRTPKLLPVLREANVVDAGAKGFVRFLEGMVALIDGHAPRPSLALPEPMPDVAASVEFPLEGDRAYRFCSEFLVRGEPLPEQRTLAEAVKDLGGSLIVTRASTVAKVHIHTDQPAQVEEALTRVGGAVERVKAEDMRAQHRARRRSSRRQVALVTDATCDLPPELVLEHDITVVPLTVAFGQQVFRDQVDITHEEFLRRLVDPAAPQPTTSQPAPAHLEGSFKRAAEHGDELLGIFVSGAVSGTLNQARTVARFQKAPVRVCDSRTASLGLGFQVLRAVELSADGWDVDRIVAELERLHPRSGVLLTVDTLKYLQRSGRVGRAKAFLGNLFGLKPILSVDDTGTMIPVDRVRGREALIPRVLELLRERVPRDRSRLRMGVAHVLAAEAADELAAALQREFDPDEMMIRPAAGVIAAHIGPGAWGVFYQAL